MIDIGKELQRINKEKALLAIEVRQLKKEIERLNIRSNDYLTIYQLLAKHHPPTGKGV